MAHDAHASAHAAHAGHDQHYVKVWALLCALLVVSIVGPMFGIRLVTLITAFGIAIVKAYLVAKNFMHVNIEGRWVAYLLIGMVAFMVVLFWGVAPDVMEHQGQRWQKLYTEPAHTAPAHAE
ncbi:MAG: cytochrome C oxidase subunit IV family protein [Acidobacteria bacterium]|nr:cytochrome C oxidase subunit IV family protein [Acidobacteriota bacterium]